MTLIRPSRELWLPHRERHKKRRRQNYINNPGAARQSRRRSLSMVDTLMVPGSGSGLLINEAGVLAVGENCCTCSHECANYEFPSGQEVEVTITSTIDCVPSATLTMLGWPGEPGGGASSNTFDTPTEGWQVSFYHINCEQAYAVPECGLPKSTWVSINATYFFPVVAPYPAFSANIFNICTTLSYCESYTYGTIWGNGALTDPLYFDFGEFPMGIIWGDVTEEDIEDYLAAIGCTSAVNCSGGGVDISELSGTVRIEFHEV